MEQYIRNIGLGFIRFNKNIFAETPVQKWKLTAYIYRKVFFLSVGSGEKKVAYKGIDLYLPAKDTTIVPSIIGGYFESLELDVFAEVAKKSKFFLDVGGNIGLYSVLGLKSNPKLNVHAFEPVQENLDYFNRNLELNGLENSDLLLNQAAVGNKTGQLTLFVSKDNSAIHSASSKHSGGDVGSSVEMTSIDKYCKDNNVKPDLIKIDIEGYDGFAIDGASKVLEQNAPTLFIEYDPEALTGCDYSPHDLLDKLFLIYKQAFVFDEKGVGVRRVKKSDIKEATVYANMNLFFSNNSNHIKLISKFIRK